MGLTTENASGVVGGSTPANATTYLVEVLKGTFVHSVGRDVKAGDVIEVSDKDYRFLKPYGFVRDAESDAEVTTEAEVQQTAASELQEDIQEAVEEAVERVESKRKQRQ